MDTIITKEDYLKVLDVKYGLKNPKIVDVSMTPLDGNEGFLGEYYILKITLKLNLIEETFFVKTKPKKKNLQNEMIIGLKAYEKEIYVYQLFKEFLRVGYTIDFVPSSYLYKDNETLVLENMCEDNYEKYPGEKFDYDHCKMVLKKLAYFHANFIGYEEFKSKKLGTFSYNENGLFDEFFCKPNDERNFGVKYTESLAECYLNLLNLLSVSQEWKNVFEKNIQRIHIGKILYQPLPYRKTIIHSDLWSNNIMFKYDKGKLKNCCIVDFQIARYLHPSYDVLLFLYANTNHEFRKKHQEEFLNFYYDSLEHTLKTYCCDPEQILTREDFLDSAKQLEICALFQAAGHRTLTGLPPNVLAKTIEEGQFEEFMFSKKRSELVEEHFKENEGFRKIISEDMHEFYDQMLYLNYEKLGL